MQHHCFVLDHVSYHTGSSFSNGTCFCSGTNMFSVVILDFQHGIRPFQTNQMNENRTKINQQEWSCWIHFDVLAPLRARLVLWWREIWIWNRESALPAAVSQKEWKIEDEEAKASTNTHFALISSTMDRMNRMWIESWRTKWTDTVRREGMRLLALLCYAMLCFRVWSANECACLFSSLTWLLLFLLCYCIALLARQIKQAIAVSFV